MPRSLTVDPHLTRQPGQLSMPAIPLHRYATDFAAERAGRGDAVLIEVLRHMMIVREFESMLASLKSTGQYEERSYTYRGPAHLSLGQEGVAVGMALSLSPSDHIYGSHRSHGEFLAKGLAAIAQLDDETLQRVMQQHENGRLLEKVSTHLPAPDRKTLAEHFLLHGLMAEIFMREDGFNRGMGGSMHAFFPPFGMYPNNAIVGASAGIATGAALARKLLSPDGITLAMAGDGSTGCGPVWEAMNFAAMAQFDTLWTDAQRGALPVLFFFTNNFYAMGGQTNGETMAWDRLSRIASGVNADGMHAETVDGTNPLAVADAVARHRTRLLAGEGPTLLDVECYRSGGHSTTDANVYRTREEMQAWASLDPIERFSGQLVDAGVLDDAAIDAMRADVKACNVAVADLTMDAGRTREVPWREDPVYIGKLMYADTAIDIASMPTTTDTSGIRRLRQNARKSRHGLDDSGKALSAMRAITLRDALFEAILFHMERDQRLIAYGEECREWGGAFGVYRGLDDVFPHQRVFNSPISEAAIVATAVGYALEGGRALVELMYADFMGRAGDEIFNQMAKWQAMSAGQLQVPVVLRCSVGSKYGAQHSQDWSAMAAHLPGLKVVYPATPYDAKGLMATSLASNDPVVFFESQRLYDTVEQFEAGGVPDDYYEIAFGSPDIKRQGTDLTILTIGPTLYPALDAARELHDAHRLSAEIIDARCLVPFDYAPVLASVRKTGHLMIVSEASERGSFAMTLANTVSRHAGDALKQAVQVLGSPNWIVPGADMEAGFFPQVDDIIDVVARDFYPDRQINRRGLRHWDDLELARKGL